MLDEKFLGIIWIDKLASHEVAYDETAVRFFDVQSSSEQPVRFRILLNLTHHGPLVQSPAQQTAKETLSHDSERTVPVSK